MQEVMDRVHHHGPPQPWPGRDIVGSSLLLLSLFAGVSLRMRKQRCLRASITFYHVLSRYDYQPVLHVGVKGDHRNLTGHSWVSIQGQPVDPGADVESFVETFRYPDGESAGPAVGRNDHG